MSTQIEDTNNIRLVVRAKNNLLLEKRESLGFTQLQMAEYCDVSLGIYSNAERLQHIPFEQAEKIALMIGTTIEKLFPNWLELFGDVVNNKNNYLLLDNSYIQKQIENREAFGSKKLLTESFHTDLDRALNSLGGRGKEVIKLYFGVNGSEQMSLREIGEKFNLTRERVRQIKERALRILRHSTRSKILSKYLGDNFELVENLRNIR